MERQLFSNLENVRDEKTAVSSVQDSRHKSLTAEEMISGVSDILRQIVGHLLQVNLSDYSLTCEVVFACTLFVKGVRASLKRQPIVAHA